jgi:hypothetical protein
MGDVAVMALHERKYVNETVSNHVEGRTRMGAETRFEER